MVDSDAAVSLDPFDVILWFRERGDEIVSHPDIATALRSRSESLVVRVKGKERGSKVRLTSGSASTASQS